MKRNIHVIAQIENKNFAIFAFEKKVNENIFIFKDYHKSNDDIESFFQNSIQKIESLINGKINSIFLLLKNGSNINFDFKIQNFETSINNNISKKDVIRNFETFKNNIIDNSEKELISIKPIIYKVINKKESNYFYEMPLNKYGETLEIEYVCTYMDKKVFDFIKNIFKKIKIEEFIFSEHLLPFSINNFKNNKHISVNIEDEYLSINFYNNQKLVKNQFFKIGLKNLYKQLIDENSDLEQLKNSIKIYGKILIDENNEDNYILNNFDFTKINKLLTKFMFLVIDKIKIWISNNKMENIPILFCGELNNIENFDLFISKNMENFDVEIAKPKKTFNLIDENIFNYLKLIDYFNINGATKKYDTLIQTKSYNINIFSKTNKILNFLHRFLVRKEKNVL